MWWLGGGLKGLEALAGLVAREFVFTFACLYGLDMFGSLCLCEVQEAMLELVDLLLREVQVRCHQSLTSTHGLLQLG